MFTHWSCISAHVSSISMIFASSTTISPAFSSVKHHLFGALFSPSIFRSLLRQGQGPARGADGSSWSIFHMWKRQMMSYVTRIYIYIYNIYIYIHYMYTYTTHIPMILISEYLNLFIHVYIYIHPYYLIIFWEMRNHTWYKLLKHHIHKNTKMSGIWPTWV